jgi:uncharacterized protein YukE
MTTPVEYQNRLEQAFNSLPGIIQDALRPAYQPVDDAVQWVCGDPDALLQAGQTYVQLGSSVTEIATGVGNDVQALEAVWTDDVGRAFKNRMDNTGKALTAAGQALSETEKILTAGARAAVDAANTICDIVVSVVEFIIADFVVSAALSVLTFGASVAAGVAAAVAEWAEATFEVSRVVEAIVKVLNTIAKVLRELAEIFKLLKEIFALLKELKKDASFLGKLGILGGKVAISKITSFSFNALPEVPSLPKGGVHWGIEGGKDGYHTYQDVKDAESVDG